jgi:hypothetical protein
MSGCRGIVFISYSDKMKLNGLLDTIGKANPDLFIINARLVERMRTFVSAHFTALKRQQEIQELGIDAVSEDGPKSTGKREPLPIDVLADPPADLAKLREELKAHLVRSPQDSTRLPRLLEDFRTACG